MPINDAELAAAKEEFNGAGDQPAALAAIALRFWPEIEAPEPTAAEVRAGVAPGEETDGALLAREGRIRLQNEFAGLREVLSGFTSHTEMIDHAVDAVRSGMLARALQLVHHAVAG